MLYRRMLYQIDNTFTSALSVLSILPSADLEVQLVQLNHCDGVYSNYWNTLLKNLKLSSYITLLHQHYLYSLYYCPGISQIHIRSRFSLSHSAQLFQYRFVPTHLERCFDLCHMVRILSVFFQISSGLSLLSWNFLL